MARLNIENDSILDEIGKKDREIEKLGQYLGTWYLKIKKIEILKRILLKKNI